MNEPDNKLLVRLEAIRYAALSIHLFEFRRPDGQALPAFGPGAHIDVHLGNRMVRQYSLAGSPNDRSNYTIGVKRETRGRGGSAWMFDELRVGDLVEISAPRNHFALHDGAAPAVLIAGGIGITPIRCMVGALAAAGRDWQLFYSVRKRAEAAFRREFEELPGGRFHLHVDDDEQGRFMDIAAIVNSAPASAHLYCCGPAPMLDAFERLCSGRAAEQVHLERFSAAVEPLKAGGFTVELARSKRSITVSPGQSIADALLDAGVKVSVSCEQGVCGTCETRVLSGIPEHRDSLLSAQEKAANDVMMICCSGSLSQTLVLDL